MDRTPTERDRKVIRWLGLILAGLAGGLFSGSLSGFLGGILVYVSVGCRCLSLMEWRPEWRRKE